MRVSWYHHSLLKELGIQNFEKNFLKVLSLKNGKESIKTYQPSNEKRNLNIIKSNTFFLFCYTILKLFMK